MPCKCKKRAAAERMERTAAERAAAEREAAVYREAALACVNLAINMLERRTANKAADAAATLSAASRTVQRTCRWVAYRRSGQT